MTGTKRAADLRPGDYIESIASRPAINLYRGTVGNVIPAVQGEPEGDVQITYEGGGYVVVGRDDQVMLRAS